MAGWFRRNDYRHRVEAEWIRDGRRGAAPTAPMFDVLNATALRGAGAGDHRHQDRAGRSADQGRPEDPLDTIANAANAGIVLGGRPIRLGIADLRGSARSAIAGSWRSPGSRPACSSIGNCRVLAANK